MSKLKVERKLNLDPSDYLCVTYRPRPKIKLPEEPEHFSLANELERFEAYQKHFNKSYRSFDWPLRFSTKQGRFWVRVFELGMTATVAKLQQLKFDEPVTIDELQKLWKAEESPLDITAYVKIASSVRPAQGFIELVTRSDEFNFFVKFPQFRFLPEHFKQSVLPILADDELEQLRAVLRPKVATIEWDANNDWPSQLFAIAPLCGMHDEMNAIIQLHPGTHQVHLNQYSLAYVPLVEMVLGLGSRDAVVHEMHRLELPLTTEDHIHGWIAHTGWDALDVVRKSILRTTTKADAELLTRAAFAVDAPELAPIMLECWIDSKATTLAGEWLRDHPANAIAGVLPLAHGQSKLANAAIEFLREMKRKGHADFIEEQLADVEDEVKKHVREQVLDHEEKEYPMLDDADMPADLKKEFDAFKVPPKSSLPKWLDVTALPPIIVKDAKLGSDNTLSLLHCLKNAPGDVEPDLLKMLRKHAQPQAMDAFVWKLFETWQREGMPSKEKWCFIAVGLFGSDASALKLTPLIREWPGMSKHQSAVTGLEVLRVIGTDTALMQLNGVAQKVKFQGIKKRAKEMMDAIASDRKMSRAELEDRIVPDLDLDEKGGRTLDFGPRQFRVMLGPDLSPVIKDDDGKVRKDLPKPNSKDDEVKAGAAVADWKLLKKQLRETLKLQAPRLENAMTTMRRWSVADFDTLFVKHPLLTNLTKRLVWAGYDDKQKQTLTFRVNEEGEFTDASDNALSLKDVATVGIVHPLHMSEPDKQAWGQLFADYEIIPPFEQLGRPVYTLTAAEKKEKVIDRLKGKKIEAIVLHGILEKNEWVRGAPQDGGWFHEHTKVYDNVSLTAVMEYDPGMGVGYMMDSGDQEVTSVFFLKSKDANDTWYIDNKKAITLKEVDPVILSEVLRTLEILGQKEKSTA